MSWITMNRPGVRNALAPSGRDQIVSLLKEASGSADIRAVVISGAGGSFCSGADLRASRSPGGSGGERSEPPIHGHERSHADSGGPPDQTGHVAQTIREGAQRLVGAILDCEKPVVAAVSGVAAGIGAHMAFACDIVIAADDARFIEVFVRRGLVPDGGGAYLLPRLVGLQRAKELLFLGDDLGAADAERLGLVNRVVPASKLEDTARDWAQRLAAGPTRAIAATKRLVNRSLESDRETAFEEEAAAQEMNMATEDAREGLKAFAERREPEFRGR